MSHRLRVGAALTFLSLPLCLPSAFANTTKNYSTQVIDPFYTVVDQFSITTDANSPVFNRPGLANVPGVTAPPTALSGGGTAVGYGTHDFTVGSDGTYNIETTINSGYALPANSPNGTSNFVQALYAPIDTSTPPTFDPTNPLQNAVLAYSQGDTTGSYNINATAGTDLTFVNTGYYNADQTGGKLSLGTTTTTISSLNYGSTTFIPDADTQGDIGTASQTLSLTDPGLVTDFNSFTFDSLEHGAVGDITAILTHDGVSVNIFNRPDTPASSNNFGSLAALDATQVYTFADKGTNFAQAAKQTVDSYASDPSADYFPIAGGTYKSLGNLSAFDGLALAGDWTLTVKDQEIGDSGSFLGFSFNATTNAPAVPEPSTIGSLSLGGGLLGLLLIRRRRNASSTN